MASRTELLAYTARIDHAARSLGHTLGWRFVTCPAALLARETPIGLITLNPGGNRDDSDKHDPVSTESGSSYWVESWNGQPAGTAVLQRQVQSLIGGIARHLGSNLDARTFADTQVLSAHFIPFRSPTLEDLGKRDESMAFARRLWSDILQDWHPRLIVTLSRDTFDELASIVEARQGQPPTEHRRFATGWGSYQAQAMRFGRRDSRPPVTLARLPHLSRFALFGRPASAAPMEDFLRYATAQAWEA